MAHVPSPPTPLPTLAQVEVAAERPRFRGEGATAMFEVQIMSDLHLEFLNTLAHLPSFEPCAPYLALLGDIGQPRKKDYLDFLKAQAARFERVFVITGNHEYYSSDRDTVNREIAQFCSSIVNLHFLHMSSVLLNDNGHKVRVLGTTLWNHCPEFYLGHLEATVNDYSLIMFSETPASPEEEPKKRQLRAVDTNRWHAEEVAWLKAAIAEAEAAGEAVVVLTHHKPGNIMGVGTEWESLLKPPVILWGYGHKHSSHQWVVNDVLVASNQLGYLQLGEKAGFCPEFVITIDHDRKSHIMRNDPDKNRREELARELAKIPMAAAPPPPPPPKPAAAKS